MAKQLLQHEQKPIQVKSFICVYLRSSVAKKGL